MFGSEKHHKAIEYKLEHGHLTLSELKRISTVYYKITYKINAILKSNLSSEDKLSLLQDLRPVFKQRIYNSKNISSISADFVWGAIKEKIRRNSSRLLSEVHPKKEKVQESESHPELKEKKHWFQKLRENLNLIYDSFLADLDNDRQ